MRMIVLPKLGGPEVLTLIDAPVPVAAADQIVVKLQYALVGFADVYQREGVYRASKTLSESEAPLKIGGGGAGTVVSTGAAVTAFKPGDRVVYGEQLGSYAEYIAVPAWRATRVPDGIDLKDVAGLPSQGATAHYLAHDTGKLAPGMTCLIHAAAGGCRTRPGATRQSERRNRAGYRRQRGKGRLRANPRRGQGDPISR